ncbi:MAG TPA: DUF5677 domain-containing protein [Caulobacter sp.]|nr:DUF5677 domain-containing protein [Caulobacter sp.]
MASRRAWEEMARRLCAKAETLFDAATPPPTALGQRDPAVVGLALLARTVHAARAVFLLLDNDHIVEARTITRSVFENAMYAAALANKGSAFVEELLADDVSIRQKRANGLAAFFGDVRGDADKKAALEAFRQQLIGEHGKPRGINMLNAAEAGGVSDAYIVYRELSTDAAHPSATSIDRHIVMPEDSERSFTLSGPPLVSEDEPAQTLALLSMGLLYINVAVNQIVGGVGAGDDLRDLTRDYQALGQSIPPDRKAAADLESETKEPSEPH